MFDRLAAAQRCAREKNQPQFRQTGDEHIIRRMEDPQVRGMVVLKSSFLLYGNCWLAGHCVSISAIALA